MSNRCVPDWQEELKIRGFYRGQVDGDFGPATLAASMAAIQSAQPREADTQRPPASMVLTDRDKLLLRTVESKLADVVVRAAESTSQAFRVAEGKRTKERQAEMVALGRSKTMNSRHLTGHAVDLWPIDAEGKTDWQNLDQFREVASAMMSAAKELGYPLTSGGISWGWDWPHFQRTWGE